MKKNIFIIVFAVTALLFTQTMSTAMCADSCLKLLQTPEALDYNPDSVKADSCIGSPTYGQFYAKGWFVVQFTYFELPAPWGPEDTIIDRTWHDIDTQYASVRNAFDTLEQTYGNFFFRKRQPEDRDTSNGRSSIFQLRFDRYVNIDSVNGALKNIPLLQFSGYNMRIVIKVGVQFEREKFNLNSKKRFILSRFSAPHLLNSLKELKGECKLFNILGNHLLSIDDTNSRDEILLSSLIALSNGSYILQLGASTIQIIVAN